ncbi:MAG: elongation factor G [Kiritimatiellaeota bacterium]|nr:elongation factor G [Kiritimatiellota bacterium]
MKDIPVNNTRNFVILGHTGSGKTSLCDALAFKLGLNDRFGSVDAGSSVADFTDEEKQRKTTLFAKPFSRAHKAADGASYGIVFTDTPGYVDFQGQMLAACAASDAALIAVDAASGVQVGTRRAWKTCQRLGLKAVGFVITGTDKENTDFEATLAQIQDAFGKAALPVTAPDGKGGVTNLLAAGGDDAKAALIEAAAGADEALMEKFFEDPASITPAETAAGLRAAMAAQLFNPVFATVAAKDAGIAELLENICLFFPAPGGRAFADKEGREVKADADTPFSAFVWRTVVDPFLGQLSLVRVVSGKITTPMEVFNASTGQKENIGSILSLVVKKQTVEAEAGPGDIVAIPKLKATETNHTLCAPGGTATFPAIEFPVPIYYLAIVAASQADEDRMSTALHRLTAQDPTIRHERDAETKETILKGMGDVHLDVAIKLMKAQSNASINTSTPKVPYRETITGRGEGEYKHKKQSGGRGQYGHVCLRVEPRQADDEEWFVDEVVGGVIPGNFMPAIQKGFVERLQAGPLARFPVQNVKIRVHFGSYHDVDSSEIAFKIAGSYALRDGLSKARPVLLEPIMSVRIFAPDQYMGAINGGLSNKRGRVLGIEADEGVQIISADVPMSEMFRYAAELGSITSGQATFEMAFSRYEPVPAAVAQKVIAEAAKTAVEDEE